MFTGLVEKIGTLKRLSRGSGLVLEIGFEPWVRPLERGESVAVNGVCLTVVDFDERRITADVLRETEERTGLGALVHQSLGGRTQLLPTLLIKKDADQHGLTHYSKTTLNSDLVWHKLMKH